MRSPKNTVTKAPQTQLSSTVCGERLAYLVLFPKKFQKCFYIVLGPTVCGPLESTPHLLITAIHGGLPLTCWLHSWTWGEGRWTVITSHALSPEIASFHPSPPPSRPAASRSQSGRDRAPREGVCYLGGLNFPLFQGTRRSKGLK